MVVGGGQKETTSDEENSVCQDSESESGNGTIQTYSQGGETGQGIEPVTSQLQGPRQGEGTRTSSLSEVSGAHNTVIHAGPGSNIYLGHTGRVEYGSENVTEDPTLLPPEQCPQREQSSPTSDTELDLTETGQLAIARPEPDHNNDPWVRWTPEGNNLHIRLPKEFCSPNIQQSVTPRCHGNDDTPCSYCEEKDAQLKTLRERDRLLEKEIASVREKLQEAKSHGDRIREERNSYISKYHELHDSQIETYTELARVKAERDRYITENHRMKEDLTKIESFNKKGKDVSASQNFEVRRKLTELNESLKSSKDDAKFWREKSEGQSRDFVKEKALHEKRVKGLQKEVNDVQKRVEKYQQQVQHLEEELEKNSDSKLMREKVQCELDLRRVRDDLARAEAEIKRKEADLNGKGRALSRLERKLQLTEHQKTEADNKVRCLEERVDRQEKKLQYLESRQREPARRAGVAPGIATTGQNAKISPGQSGLSPRQPAHAHDRLGSISEDDEVTSSPLLNRRKSCPDNKTLRRQHRRETL